MLIKPRLIVGVDVDGTVADIHTPWLSLYNSDYGDNLQLDQITDWGIHKFVKPECGKDIYKYLRMGALYESAKPIKGAQTAVALLRHHDVRVVLITACVPGTAETKREWLARHQFFDSDDEYHKDYIVCSDKRLIDCHVLIDDGPDNVRSFFGKRLLFDRPWNRHVTEVPRLIHWPSVLYKIRSL